jgi:hypothetical protein
MRPTYAQPDGSLIPAELVNAILRRAASPGVDAPTFTLEHHDQYSNDLALARLADGRRLIVKRGRYGWSRERFETSRFAADLLRTRGIITPESLEIPAEIDEHPLDVYWWIELPTLLERWQDLRESDRACAMVSLGGLIRRMHRIHVAGHGDLRQATAEPQPLAEVLANDLNGRLRPAVRAEWPRALPLVEKLERKVPGMLRKACSAVATHGDLHLGNVLCQEEAGSIHCVGLLDLESASAAPPESDLARLAVMHTDLFGMPIEEDWLEWVIVGYEDPVDPVVFEFYALYHLVQLGLHSAMVGHEEHAELVAAAAGG